jgi:hypothetical protein
MPQSTPIPQAYQSNFTGGELSPNVDARVDLAKYYNGCALLENMLVIPQGGACKRPGTQFVAEVKVSSLPVRLIPFIYSQDQSYVLEFGDQYIRFFCNHGRIEIVQVTGWKICGTGANSDRGGKQSWTTPGAITADDAAYASCSINPQAYNDWLRGTNYGFADGDIPAGSVIRGIEVEIQRKASSAGFINDSALYLRLSGGRVGTNKAAATYWGTSEEPVVYGGPTDLWGTTWARTDIVGNTAFGLDLSAYNSHSFINITAYVDCYRIRIYYAPATGVVYEISSPYKWEDLPDLDFRQSADILYIAHPDYPTYQLMRLGHTDWKMQTINFNPAPLKPASFFPAATLTPAEYSGRWINLTASAPSFIAADVLRMIKVKGKPTRAIIREVTSSTVVRADIINDFDSLSAIEAGNWYIEGTPNTSLYASSTSFEVGSVITLIAPIECIRGSDMDKYISAKGGFYRIKTAWAGGSFTVLVIRAPNVTVITDWNVEHKCYVWDMYEESWAVDDYPKCLGFLDNRMIMVGSNNNPLTIWGSEVGNFNCHILGEADSNAFIFSLSADQVDRILWMSGRKYIILGTPGGEWVVSGGDKPLTPTNIMARMETSYGCAAIKPCEAGNILLFVQRGKLKLLEMVYDLQSNNLVGSDLTIMADHITGDGVVFMDYQKEPDANLWAGRNDGVLIGLTHHRDEKVAGWHRQITDGLIESGAVIPYDQKDELWMVVNRTIGGATKRYVEFMKGRDYGSDLADAWFVDSGLQYVGAPATVLSGLDHLNGKTVAVFADGLVQASKVVSGGQITLDVAASKVQVGLPYTAKLQSMKLNIPNTNQQGYTKRVHEAVVNLLRTVGGSLGPDAANLESINPGATTEFTGDKIVKYRGAWETEARIYLEHSTPTPITVLAVMPRFMPGEK